MDNYGFPKIINVDMEISTGMMLDFSAAEAERLTALVKGGQSVELQVQTGVVSVKIRGNYKESGEEVTVKINLTRREVNAICTALKAVEKAAKADGAKFVRVTNISKEEAESEATTE